MEKIRTNVRICGKDYTLVGYDPEDYVRRVALYVERKIHELETATRLSTQDATVLSAVTMADELIKAQEENRRLRAEVERARAELEAAGRGAEAK